MKKNIRYLTFFLSAPVLNTFSISLTMKNIQLFFRSITYFIKIIKSLHDHQTELESRALLFPQQFCTKVL